MAGKLNFPWKHTYDHLHHDGAPMRSNFKKVTKVQHGIVVKLMNGWTLTQEHDGRPVLRFEKHGTEKVYGAKVILLRKTVEGMVMNGIVKQVGEYPHYSFVLCSGINLERLIIER